MKDQEYLRSEYQRLFKMNGTQDYYDMIEIYSTFFLDVVLKQGKETVEPIESDAEIILQMMMTKLLALKNMIDGISFNGVGGKRLNNVIDPTVVANITRAIFETSATFNLMFRVNTGNERKIMHNLWKHSGLATRQRFEEAAQNPINLGKLEGERLQMEKLREEIRNNPVFQNLAETEKDKIFGNEEKKKKGCIEKKEYLVSFRGNRVIVHHWQDVADTKIGVRRIPKKDENGIEVKDENGKVITRGILDDIYPHLSLYSHPSYVAVFQFQEFFDAGSDRFNIITKASMRNSFILMGIFIADYINLFPKVLETFNTQSLRNQIMIDYYNRFARGVDFSINHSYKALD